MPDEPAALEAPAPARRDEHRWRAVRAALANLRAAAETLEAYPEMEIVRRTRLLQVVVEEIERLSRTLSEFEAADSGTDTSNAGPVPAEDLLQRIEDAMVATGLRLERTLDEPRHVDLEVVVPARPLTAELARLALGLRVELGVGRVRLGASRIEHHLRLDLGWPIVEGRSESISAWVLDALSGLPLANGESCSLRELVRQIGGEVWFTLDRDGSDGHLRLLLPSSLAPAPLAAG